VVLTDSCISKGARRAKTAGLQNVAKEMKMNFTPVGRYLLVEPIEIRTKKNKTAKVLVPDSYNTKNTPRFKMCRVVKAGPDCNSQIAANTLAVIENPMVERVEVLDNVFFIILENHVVGLVEE